MAEVPDCLREAYIHDVIDLDTFERFTTYFVRDEPCALPQEVITMAGKLAWGDDSPGRVYFPFGRG